MKRMARAALVGLVSAGLLLVALAVFLRRPSFGRPASLLHAHADAARLARHVEVLTTDFLPRAADDPASLERTAAYVETAFRDATSRVESQRFTAGAAEYRNVIAHFGPPGDARIVVGAHYDAMGLLATTQAPTTTPAARPACSSWRGCCAMRSSPAPSTSSPTHSKNRRTSPRPRWAAASTPTLSWHPEDVSTR